MTIIIFLLVLSILVLVHEFGHFIVAKLSGVKVEEFGLGFPPRLISIRYGETIYSVNALPFGGFVRLYGEDLPARSDARRADKAGQKVAKDANRAFSSKSKKIRAGVIVAGVIMNFLLAIVAFSTLYSIVGIPRKTDAVRVIGLSESSPAKEAGIVMGDQIVAVDGKTITSNTEFIQLIENKKGKEVEIELRTKGEERRSIKVTPRESPPEGEGPLGVLITDNEQYFPPLWQRPFFGAWYGFWEALSWGAQTVLAVAIVLKQLVTTATLPHGLAGPVGIFQITGTAAREGGALAVLQLMGILSVNLAILNVLPIPALDGGRLLFVGIEAVLRNRAREVLPKVERVSNVIGFALLIALLLAITLQDVRRLIGQ